MKDTNKKIMTLLKKNKYMITAVIFLIFLLAVCVFLIRRTIVQSHEVGELKNKITEMESRQIEVDSIREEVKQISKYSAYEFQYTSVICFSDKNQFMGIKIPLTGNSFIATIDGKINIGIDGEQVRFDEKTNSEGKVTRVVLTVPHSEILANYTIQESLEIYDEKNNVFNPVKIEDYNDLIIEAEVQEKEKVLQSDLIQKSDDTIRYLLTSHFQAVYGKNVEIEYKFLNEKNQ